MESYTEASHVGFAILSLGIYNAITHFNDDAIASSKIENL